jgi:hypothetical protein
MMVNLFRALIKKHRFSAFRHGFEAAQRTQYSAFGHVFSRAMIKEGWEKDSQGFVDDSQIWLLGVVFPNGWPTLGVAHPFIFLIFWELAPKTTT